MTLYITVPEGKKLTAIAARYLGDKLVEITRLSDGSIIPVKPAIRRRVELAKVATERP